LESELINLKIKYDDVCERVTAATLQLERVQVVLEQTLRRCEQLEKEKVRDSIDCRHEYTIEKITSNCLSRDSILVWDSASSAAQEIGIICRWFSCLSSSR
jgi:hypothetical protein